jgi:hypothetical protein
MSDLATVIGLCCLDGEFRQDVKNQRPGTLRRFVLTKGDCAKLARVRDVLETCGAQFDQIQNAITSGWQTLTFSARDEGPCETPPCETPPC